MATEDLKVRIVANGVIYEVRYVTVDKYVSGFGKDAVFEKETVGWAVDFGDFSIMVQEDPGLLKGSASIIIEQVQDAQIKQSSEQ